MTNVKYNSVPHTSLFLTIFCGGEFVSIFCVTKHVHLSHLFKIIMQYNNVFYY